MFVNLLPLDELNTLKASLTAYASDGETMPEAMKRHSKRIHDDILDFLIDAYICGSTAAAEMLGLKEPEPDIKKFEIHLGRTIEGKTWEDRLNEHIESGDLAGVIRVADTEGHTAYVEGGDDEATEATKKPGNHLLSTAPMPTLGGGGSSPTSPMDDGLDIFTTPDTDWGIYPQPDTDADTAMQNAPAGTVFKRWHSMEDEKVRETHDYLNGMTIPLASEFYTAEGAHGAAPGLFGVPSEDINCRCLLEYIVK